MGERVIHRPRGVCLSPKAVCLLLQADGHSTSHSVSVPAPVPVQALTHAGSRGAVRGRTTDRPTQSTNQVPAEPRSHVPPTVTCGQDGTSTRKQPCRPAAPAPLRRQPRWQGVRQWLEGGRGPWGSGGHGCHWWSVWHRPVTFYPARLLRQHARGRSSPALAFVGIETLKPSVPVDTDDVAPAASFPPMSALRADA